MNMTSEETAKRLESIISTFGDTDKMIELNKKNIVDYEEMRGLVCYNDKNVTGYGDRCYSSHDLTVNMLKNKKGDVIQCKTCKEKYIIKSKYFNECTNRINMAIMHEPTGSYYEITLKLYDVISDMIRSYNLVEMIKILNCMQNAENQEYVINIYSRLHGSIKPKVDYVDVDCDKVYKIMSTTINQDGKFAYGVEKSTDIEKDTVIENIVNRAGEMAVISIKNNRDLFIIPACYINTIRLNKIETDSYSKKPGKED